VAAQASHARWGALLVLVMGMALAVIPALMFPILRRHDEVLAVGYVIFRGALETATYLGVAICWLLLVVDAQQYADAGAQAAPQYSALGTFVVKAMDPIVAIQDIVFSLGALMFCTVLYRSILLPRWISVWGFVGVAGYLTTGVLALFGPAPVILLMPLALQEMVMAVWLIAKGFTSSALAPEGDRQLLAGHR
jgi:hypothetical protein